MSLFSVGTKLPLLSALVQEVSNLLAAPAEAVEEEDWEEQWARLMRHAVGALFRHGIEGGRAEIAEKFLQPGTSDEIIDFVVASGVQELEDGAHPVLFACPVPGHLSRSFERDPERFVHEDCRCKPHSGRWPWPEETVRFHAVMNNKLEALGRQRHDAPQ
jgi:hypothetical protein